MTISELVEKLEELRTRHGELTVWFSGYGYDGSEVEIMTCEFNRQEIDQWGTEFPDRVTLE